MQDNMDMFDQVYAVIIQNQSDILLGLCIIFLLFFSAFFSASETAMTTLSRARLLRMVEKGNTTAHSVQKLLDKPSTMITAILIANNAVNIVSSVLATSLLLRIFGNSGIFYTSVLMTVMIVIFAEILPKNLALADSQRVAFLSVRPLSLCIKLLMPLVILMRPLISYTARKGYKSDIALDNHIVEELRGAIQLSRKGAGLFDSDHDMLDGVLDLSELTVRDVMVHRMMFYAIELNQPVQDVISKLASSPYSRMPVFAGKEDNIVGMVDIKTVLRGLHEKNLNIEQFSLKELMYKPWFVPESTNLKLQLNAFLKRRRHFAIVVDEYGEVMGLITLEDILEEIVGNITDEYDKPQSDTDMHGDAIIEVEGNLSIRELNRLKDWQLPEDIAITVAGLVVNQAEIIPQKGQKFTFFKHSFEIMERKDNRITRIRVKKETH